MDDSPFEYIWVDRISEIHAPIGEGHSKMPLPDGTVIQPREIVLSLRNNNPYKVNIIGETDAGDCHTGTVYLDDHRDYPEDLVQLITTLVEMAAVRSGGFGVELEDDWLTASERTIGPGDIAVLLRGPSCHITAANPN